MARSKWCVIDKAPGKRRCVHSDAPDGTESQCVQTPQCGALKESDVLPSSRPGAVVRSYAMVGGPMSGRLLPPLVSTPGGTRRRRRVKKTTRRRRRV
jgi:hypothetical protein